MKSMHKSFQMSRSRKSMEYMAAVTPRTRRNSLGPTFKDTTPIESKDMIQALDEINRILQSQTGEADEDTSNSGRADVEGTSATTSATEAPYTPNEPRALAP